MKFLRNLSNFFVSIDQLGNVLAGGNPDNTISSRVGYYTEQLDGRKISFRWKIFRSIINFTFYPIDGKHHCREAYFNDAGENFDAQTSDIAIAILTIIIIPSCLIISVLLYFLYILGIVSPKRINRNKNIKNRLIIAEAKLNGAFQELNMHKDKVKINEELEEILDKTQETLNQVSHKVNTTLERNRKSKDS